MYSVIIVDDEFINRTVIKNMIQWEKCGFSIVAELGNGEEALEFIRKNHVDVVITDMKMPVMGGLELINQIKNQEIITIALSSFDEYELVREAFKLGVEDYLLKMKLSEEYLMDTMAKVYQRLEYKKSCVKGLEHKNALISYLGKMELDYEESLEYVCMLIELPDVLNIKKRFGDIETNVISPMIDLILQLPIAKNQCEYAQYGAASLLIRYKKESMQYRDVERLYAQVKNTISNYMNIAITMSASHIYFSLGQLQQAIDDVKNYMDMRFLFGEYELYCPESKLPVTLEELKIMQPTYGKLMEAFRKRNGEWMHTEEEQIFAQMQNGSNQDIQKMCYGMIYAEVALLKEREDSLWSIFGYHFSIQNKIERLINSKDYFIWIYNFNRYVLEHLVTANQENTQGSFEVVRRYIEDNYIHKDFNLSEVASVIGLNDTYFSMKFKKEFGMNFSDYLKQLRIRNAKNLIKTTNMKVYEVSEAVGYNNVEHFTRVFKNVEGVSPKKYMESI